jgi:hypothetical protein
MLALFAGVDAKTTGVAVISNISEIAMVIVFITVFFMLF